MSVALVSKDEAARRLGISRRGVERLIRRGELESLTIGQLRRIPENAIAAYVARRLGPSAPAVEMHWRPAPEDVAALQRLLRALFEPDPKRERGEGGGGDAA
jgi:excisionase family DNA binding protein